MSHIIAGSLSLILGFVQIILKKYGPVHVWIGRLFTISMGTTGVTAILLSEFDLRRFLFWVGIFTLYMVISGWVARKEDNPKYKVVVAASMAILIFGLIGMFTYAFQNISSNSFFMIPATGFGLIALLFLRLDYRLYFSGKTHKYQKYLRAHIARMTGAFVASATAFLVVNIGYAWYIFASSILGGAILIIALLSTVPEPDEEEQKVSID